MMARALMNRPWEIFGTFLKIGPTTFGGGYAMIPVIQLPSISVFQVRSWEAILGKLSLAS
ncbi:chromate transporter [Paenibacillus sp. GCM10023248]|uniref:chromate transporter n=1 Tax=Bacillales TaxID=1385 RepID=UPI002377DBF9|nr:MULTISPECIES: chromate transporter [Bacillales]MDD9269715.1 hypothetical protein [Paenibacillus sp. MAHUQ-63]MDR6881873.1 chromate transport protein ChrA [Bacillus sp. 3255]